MAGKNPDIAGVALFPLKEKAFCGGNALPRRIDKNESDKDKL